MRYEKVNQIRLPDDDFKVSESRRRPRGGDGGAPMRTTRPLPPGPGFQGPAGSRGGLLFGKDLCYIFFLGTPPTTVPRILQFGGHHLALNIAIPETEEC
jgi:hypothetical protein